ncbi:MAG TPA: HAD-IB family phosphatase [Chloroflexota bacterium]|nr:HAD-IB family phosphatase [Chloroflexota bacterium]
MRWPPYEHIFFDCDSTLTAVEGIDILAEMVGKKWRVEVLTNAAMDGKLDLADVYAKRLQAIKPTAEQIRDIRRIYKRHVVEDAREVIAALHALGHQVYIISGGLAEPVAEFGVHLGVPRDHIRAVHVDYNQLTGRWWETTPTETDSIESGRYLDYEEGALTISDGKAHIVRELLGEQHGRTILIGDGSSDLLAGKAVDLFVGYGGVVERQRVRREAPVFMHTPSLSPLLLLAAGPAAGRLLQNTPHARTFEKGYQLIQTGALSFNHDKLESKFFQAISATYQTVHSGAD